MGWLRGRAPATVSRRARQASLIFQGLQVQTLKPASVGLAPAASPGSTTRLRCASRRFVGRNRESRSREAAGRRNWPEAVPRKMSGKKRPLTRLRENQVGEQTRIKNSGEIIRNARPPWDRHASLAAREYMSRERPQQLIPVMRRLMLLRPSYGPRTTSWKSGGSRGGPSLCPRRDQSRPLSFPVRQSDAEHQHALRRVPCEYRLRECAEQPHRKSLRTGRLQTT